MRQLQESNAALPKLDARLAAAAAYVRHGCVCADIGCDHGKLSVYLAAHHLCKKVIACDIRPMPLRQAARNLALHGCTQQVECRLGNGLSVVSPHEVDDILVAGMSGVTIAGILESASAFWHEAYRFIFVPASKDEVLRAWLAENGFVLLDETPVEAAGRLYTVLSAQYTGQRTAADALSCAVGLVFQKETPAAAAYLEKTARAARRRGEIALAEQIEALAQQCRARCTGACVP